MQAFLEYIVKGLVQHPEEVTITPVEHEGTTVYELRMHPQDVGKVIGRQGMTINAIRSLLLAGSARKGLRCTLEIVEEKPADRKSTRLNSSHTVISYAVFCLKNTYWLPLCPRDHIHTLLYDVAPLRGHA